MIARRLRSERGYALVTAVSVLGIMLVVGLSVITLSDTGSDRVREQRVRESALNLAEGVLYGQGFALAHRWPATVASVFPKECTSAQAPSAFCPNRDVLSQANSATPAAAAFRATSGSTDFAVDGSWTAQVRDDFGQLAQDFDASVADGPLSDGVRTCGTTATGCTWDFNGNRRMWVKAAATVRGKRRVLVAKLQLETLTEAIPQTAVTSGALRITNAGNNVMVDSTGSNVLLRCNPSSQSCAYYEPNQITPSASTVGPPAVAAPGNLMSPDQLARFKQAAMTNGKYFDGCAPKDADLSGPVVWVEGCKPATSYANTLVTTPCDPPAPAGMSQNCINSIDKPGVLIWHCGQADFQGGMTFVGVFYAANNSDGTCESPFASTEQIGNGRCSNNKDREAFDIVYFNGGFGVWGALASDGPGCMKLGSNGLQAKYDARVFASIASYGTVGLIQNTWRELPANE